MFVRSLMAKHLLDGAISLAVGGEYHRIGAIAADVAKACGLREHDPFGDLGCGSGRLAKRLDRRYTEPFALPQLVFKGKGGPGLASRFERFRK
ncbi:MAG TPA: hypothetical protein VGJ20_34660 [Xanthobacteraceae bacterium]